MPNHDFSAAGLKLAWGFVVAATLAGPAFAQVEILAPPTQQSATETLEEAWQVALSGDQRVEAGQWQVSSAQNTFAAAQAERLPSLTLGADYYALSQKPELISNLPGGLTPRHWEIIRFLRNYYQATNNMPTLYQVCEAHHLDLEGFRELFPEGYRRGACRIAGLPFFA